MTERVRQVPNDRCLSSTAAWRPQASEECAAGMSSSSGWELFDSSESDDEVLPYSFDKLDHATIPLTGE